MIHSTCYVFRDTYTEILTAPLLGSLPQFKSCLKSNSKNVTINTTSRKQFALKGLLLRNTCVQLAKYFLWNSTVQFFFLLTLPKFKLFQNQLGIFSVERNFFSTAKEEVDTWVLPVILYPLTAMQTTGNLKYFFFFHLNLYKALRHSHSLTAFPLSPRGPGSIYKKNRSLQ